MPTTTSHREQKKARTRLALRDEAMRLFADRGYTSTTVADIAAAADVAPRTFFSYFPSKEAVLFAWLDEPLARLRRALAERPHGEPALRELQRWVMEEFVTSPEPWGGFEAVVEQVVADVPAVLAYGSRIEEDVQGWLTEAVASDLGVDPRDLLPGVVAAATVAALSRTSALGGRAGTATEVEEQIDLLFDFVGSGLRAVGASAPSALGRRSRRRSR